MLEQNLGKGLALASTYWNGYQSNKQFVSNVNQKEKRNDFDSHFGAFSCHHFYVELIV